MTHRTGGPVLLTGLTEELMTMADGYRGLTEYQRALLSELDQVGRDISGRMMDAMGRVQFQDIVRQQVDSVLAGMGGLRAFNLRMADRQATGADSGGSENLKAVLTEMTRTYVTETQRRRHEEVVNGARKESNDRLLPSNCSSCFAMFKRKDSVRRDWIPD